MVAADTGSHCRSLPFPFLVSAERGTRLRPAAGARPCPAAESPLPPRRYRPSARRRSGLPPPLTSGAQAAPRPAPPGPPTAPRGAARAPQRRGSRQPLGDWARVGWGVGGRLGARAAVGRLARGGRLGSMPGCPEENCRPRPGAAGSRPGGRAAEPGEAGPPGPGGGKRAVAGRWPGAGQLAAGSIRCGSVGSSRRYPSRAGHRGFL